MAYIDGFVLPVPADRRDAYAEHARRAWPLFRMHGALRMVECWGDDVPDGVTTSFPMAVKLEPGEVAVFSWIEWPDKATRDRCHAGMMSDPDWQAADKANMPFDGRRMIFGGFVPVLDVT
jgi:uncharacterized protein YbaA (DUF1428 family)